MESAEGFKDLRLDNHLFEVESRFQGGLTVERLIHERGNLFTFDSDRTPDIVYLQIGGNCLSDSRMTVQKVANNIYSFACYLHFSLNIRTKQNTTNRFNIYINKGISLLN